jgi:hypothetical protein
MRWPFALAPRWFDSRGSRRLIWWAKSADCSRFRIKVIDPDVVQHLTEIDWVNGVAATLRAKLVQY